MRLIQKKTIQQEVAVGIECDVCGKRTSDINDPDFYNFSSHHSDWGSDSEDSYENHDVCSAHCYIDILKVLESENDSQTFEADGKSLPFIKRLINGYKHPEL